MTCQSTALASHLHMWPLVPQICAVPPRTAAPRKGQELKGRASKSVQGLSCNFSPPGPDFLLPITLRSQFCFWEHPSWLGLGSYLGQGQTQVWHFCWTGREMRLGLPGSHRTLSTQTEEFGVEGLALWESHGIMQEGVKDSIQFLSAPPQKSSHVPPFLTAPPSWRGMHAQSFPTLQSYGLWLPGFSVHGILQKRILERVAITYSRGSFWPRDLTCISHVFCIGRQILYP